MSIAIKDPLAKLLDLQIVSAEGNTLTTSAESMTDVTNRYGIAHGGYLHTLAHLTSVMAVEQLLGGSWEAEYASCQFLRALRQFPAKTTATLVSAEGCAPLVRGEVYDAKGLLCFTQMMGLRQAAPTVQQPKTHTPMILHANPMPADLNVEPPFPCLSTSFSRMLNCYSIRKQGTGLVYALDLNEKNCDANGFVHPAAVFTLADAAAGGSMVRIEKKSPITVSAFIRFLEHGEDSLVEAIPRLTRGGRALYFYDVDIVDGAGRSVATGQFVIQNLDA